MTRTLPLFRTNHPHKRTVTVLIGIESRLLANPSGLPHADMARYAGQVALVVSDALKLSPGTRGAKWKDLPHPYS